MNFDPGRGTKSPSKETKVFPLLSSPWLSLPTFRTCPPYPPPPLGPILSPAPPPTDSHSLPCTSLFRAPTLVKYHRRSDPLGAFRLYNHGVLLHKLRRKAPQPTSHKAVIRHRQSTDAMFEVGRSLFYTQYRAASNSCGPDPGPQVPCKCEHA